MDGQLLSDATGRNALYKIHVSLGKIVNNLDAAAGTQDAVAGRRSVSRATSVSVDDKTIVQDRTVVEDRTIAEEMTVVIEPDIKEEEEESDGDGIDVTVVRQEEEGDSLVDELLTDEEGTVM